MAMSELGAFLQRQRTERGFTLEALEAETHIRRAYLEAMEAGDWDALPPGVYTRGLLKNYARALGVSSASVLRMYVKERPSESRLPEPQLISRALVETPRMSTESLAGIALMVVALGLFAWVIWTRLIPDLTSGSTGNPIPTSSTGAVAQGSPASGRSSGTASPRRTAVPVGATVAPLPSDTPEAAAIVSGTPATAVPETPQPSATAGAVGSPAPAVTGAGPRAALVMEILATKDSWLSVLADDQYKFEGILKAGEKQRWEATQKVWLHTGNAGATEVTINGRRLDPLGKSGEVVKRQWKLLASGDIEQSG
jgi:cytoskeletal protein RodZ